MRFLSSTLIVLLVLSQTVAAADIGELIRQGETKLQAGEIDAAARVFEQAVAQDARSPLAHTRLGGALLLKQEQTAAIGQFREAIMLDSRNAQTFIGMAVAEIHLGRYALARAALVEAKGIDPAKGQEIDRLVVWLDGRESSSGGTSTH
ncbi:tetratricopeptide repeat protein [Thiocystis violascens]|uniref:Uncharacterized protein n=1 Tax=Thiocystis violascens (strain ATCC 17096 / DSM 198 / 6111) TaxID=765911 RepID=I3Y9N4_THIV6|nr:tetratricopeptide repeat protein [Thiocystis violascens]AFL73702.1 hypothetical protein Thivi_1728 [Thiocystis violascens DSM 198]